MKPWKQWLYIILSHFLDISGLYPLIVRLISRWQYSSESKSQKGLRRRKGPILTILTYHRVNDEADLYFPGTPTAVFAQQIDYLRRCYQIVDLHQILAGGPIPERAVCLSFDDGYLDNFTHAFPVLKSRRVPATVFLATGFIGTGRVIWHDEVFHAFRTNRKVLLDWPGTAFHNLPLTSVTDRIQTMEGFLEFIRSLDPSDRDATIAILQERLAVGPLTGNGKRLMMNWDEAREMSRQGISFGAHTVNHTLLSTVSGQDLYEELEGSRSALQENLGLVPRIFAYPNGRLEDFGPDSVELLHALGFRAAVTTVPGVNNAASDLFRLSRINISGEDPVLFRSRLAWYQLTLSGQ
jgi:peptidoglycan/xylan/chitin deacetylase (PgdA/CDA1 family)